MKGNHVSKNKVPVSERALVARCVRVLKKDGNTLRICQEGSRSFSTLGRFYTLDLDRNVVLDSDVDLEELAKKLGCLRGYEALDVGS
jgi:hypothetical protein